MNDVQRANLDLREKVAAAWATVAALTPDQREAVALVIDNAEVEGSYHWNGEESVFEDSVSDTLQALASKVRTAAPLQS